MLFANDTEATIWRSCYAQDLLAFMKTCTEWSKGCIGLERMGMLQVIDREEDYAKALKVYGQKQIVAAGYFVSELVTGKLSATVPLLQKVAPSRFKSFLQCYIKKD